MATMTGERVTLRDAPAIQGLEFRRFRGDVDYPEMVAVLQASRLADNNDSTTTVEEMATQYATSKNLNPYEDVLIAEVGGKMVAWNRTEWWVEDDGTHIYGHFGYTRPEWRGKGIELAMLRHAEQHLRDIAARHPADAKRVFDTWTWDAQQKQQALLESEGYAAVRHFYHMVRPNMDNIPDLPMPEGLEVRPVRLEQLHDIWDAETEAFRDHWGSSQVDEADYNSWLHSSDFQPELWQVAWDGEQVAGMVRTYISEEENRQFNRQRGYTENISTRRPWRKRGLAHALIARSLQLQKDLGMTESALGVDAENPNGALHIYKSMGFEVQKRGSNMRKPME